jgi:predicted nucleotide-binding protein
VKHTEDSVQRALQSEWSDIARKDISRGVQFRLPEGTTINFYPGTARVVVQGRDNDEKKRAEHLLNVPASTAAGTAVGTSGAAATPQKVFIVYGHDTKAREQLELLLRRLRLEPVILANLPSKGQTIIEKLEEHREVKYACVLLTPDDEGFRRDHPDEKQYRARQNVVLELGMFLAALGRKRVAILHTGNVELPSDIHGLVYIPFKQHVSEAKQALAAEMQEVGFQINIKDMLGG